MDKAKLEELARLHAAATKGKWGVWTGSASVYNNITSNHPSMLEQAKGSRIVCSCEEEEMEADRQGKRDAKWIAASKNAFPDLLAYVRELERERERLKQWRELHKDNVDCPACNGTAINCATCTESGLVGLYERDAKQRREGAVMKLLDMSLGGFAWDETGLRREAEAMLLDAGEHSQYDSMLDAAKRLREGL